MFQTTTSRLYINSEMTRFLFAFLCVILILVYTKSARILAVYPIPSISHQISFRPLTHELAKRGHDVTVITPNPVYPNGKAPTNLTEIDVHDMSYKLWQEIMPASSNAQPNLELQLKMIFEVISLILENILQTGEVKDIIKENKGFDLLILEACVRPALVFSHLFKAPVILISSLGAVFDNHYIMGSSIHPFLYSTPSNKRIYGLTMWEKIHNLYVQYLYHSAYFDLEEAENDMIRRNLGNDVPKLSELQNNVDMLLLNVHPIWEDNRPVPPSVIYVGGMHELPEKDLPSDLKSYLDSSENGVIYISFGTNVIPSMLPRETIQILINVFSKLPYNVLWKWDKEELPGRTDNIKIMKWLPQADLLRHHKIKLFINQGGLQSIYESIKAGVPMIGIPMFADQWYNTEKYVRHKIGKKIDIEKLNEYDFIEACNTVIDDESHRRNVEKLRSVLYDQPQRPLERAVWWTEHVLRHGGARHLRGAAANMYWTEYLELRVIALILCMIIVFLLTTILITKISLRIIYKLTSFESKLKKN